MKWIREVALFIGFGIVWLFMAFVCIAIIGFAFGVGR